MMRYTRTHAKRSFFAIPQNDFWFFLFHSQRVLSYEKKLVGETGVHTG